MIDEIKDISNNVARVKLIKDGLDTITHIQKYVSDDHNKALNDSLEKAKTDINKYVKRFLLEKDSIKKIIADFIRRENKRRKFKRYDRIEVFIKV